MAYQKSTKKLNLTNLYTALTGIADIGFVDWQRIYDDSMTKNNCPGIYINDMKTDKVKKLKDLVKNTFVIELASWVWAEDDENLGDVMESFMEAIEDAVTTDTTRGGNAYDTIIDTIETDAGSQHPQGFFVVRLNIIFFSAN